MRCSECGSRIPEDSVFCPECGSPIVRAAASDALRPGIKAKTIALIAVVVAMVAGVLLIGIHTSWFGLTGDGATTATTTSSSISSSSSAPAAASASAVASASSFSSSGGSSDASVGATASAGTSGSPSIKPSVNDYTWDELSAISDEIAESGSANNIVLAAEKYNLCTADGKLDGTQVKSITLSDGTQAEVQIVGFCHDDKSDGSGKAGITFIFKDAVAEHGMNPNDDNTGGWEASEMRSWLSSDFMAMLPADLAKDIVTVDKLTNNTGATADVSSVTTTHDAIWLFSTEELCGDIDWWPDPFRNYNGVLGVEGTQYQLFADADVSSFKGNDILTKSYLPASSASGWIQGETCDWWVRSALPNTSSYFCGVDSDGYTHVFVNATTTYGVAPGFCI